MIPVSPSFALGTCSPSGARMICPDALANVVCTQSPRTHLNVAWVTLVRIDSTVCSVRAAAGLWCLLNLDVSDDEAVGIDLVASCVALCVLQQVEEELGRFDGPSTCLREVLHQCQFFPILCDRPCAPWVVLKAFACAVRPTPPLNLLKGTHCLCSWTSAR